MAQQHNSKQNTAAYLAKVKSAQQLADSEMNDIVDYMAKGLLKSEFLAAPTYAPLTLSSTGPYGTVKALPPVANMIPSQVLSRDALERRESGDARWLDLIPGDTIREVDGPTITLTGVDSSAGANLWSTGAATSRDERPLRASGHQLISGGPLPVAPTKGKGKVDFDTVIMPEAKKAMIIDAIQQVDNHDLIFNTWGFGEVFEKGTAISLLFYGEPGTGKTLMAQAIADKYNYQLKIVSTAEIETPEPGGAERNIQKYFQEADERTVLLFDECDSLISDRKHLGMIMAAQVNALLTALERHKGIVIFTTNRLGALDPAFDRRLSLKLEFEMPDAKHRVLIWKRMFPEQAPLAKDIDWETIADVAIAGGHIKNVVLRAARRAANTTKKITQDIIVEALLEEVKSNEAFKEALANHSPFYGTPVARGVGVTRGRGKVEVDRG